VRRKDQDAERMASAMVAHTRDLSSLAIRGSTRSRTDYNPNTPIMMPKWI
jgi:hypothetical protein